MREKTVRFGRIERKHGNASRTLSVLTKRLNLAYAPKISNSEIGVAALTIGCAGKTVVAKCKTTDKGSVVGIVIENETNIPFVLERSHAAETELLTIRTFVARDVVDNVVGVFRLEPRYVLAEYTLTWHSMTDKVEGE